MTSLSSKRCHICHVVKPLSEFHKDRTRVDGRQYRCKSCQSAYTKKRRADDYDAHITYHRAYREANRERRRQQERASYQRRIEHERARGRRRAKDPRAKVSRRAIKARYRARLAQAEGSFSAEDIRSRLEAQKGRCHWCGVKLDSSYHVDHVIPLIQGGSNHPHNICISCPTCNKAKSGKMPHDFAGRLF